MFSSKIGLRHPTESPEVSSIVSHSAIQIYLCWSRWRGNLLDTVAESSDRLYDAGGCNLRPTTGMMVHGKVRSAKLPVTGRVTHRQRSASSGSSFFYLRERFFHVSSDRSLTAASMGQSFQMRPSHSRALPSVWSAALGASKF